MLLLSTLLNLDEFMNKVENLFASKAINRGGIYLYSKEIALKFIEECKKQDIPILGIDSFYLTDSTIQPSMDNNIDFSTHSFKKGVFDEAKQFLKQRGDDLYFEIVCAE
jgi:hypothetical protein